MNLNERNPFYRNDHSTSNGFEGFDYQLQLQDDLNSIRNLPQQAPPNVNTTQSSLSNKRKRNDEQLPLQNINHDNNDDYNNYNDNDSNNNNNNNNQLVNKAKSSSQWSSIPLERRAKYRIKHREADAKRREKEIFYLAKLQSILQDIDPSLSEGSKGSVPKVDLLALTHKHLLRLFNTLQGVSRPLNPSNYDDNDGSSYNYNSAPWLRDHFNYPNKIVLVCGTKWVNNIPFTHYYDANESFLRENFLVRSDVVNKISNPNNPKIGHLSIEPTPTTRADLIKIEKGLIDECHIALYLKGNGLSRLVHGRCRAVRNKQTGQILYKLHEFSHINTEGFQFFVGDVRADQNSVTMEHYKASLVISQNNLQEVNSDPRTNLVPFNFQLEGNKNNLSTDTSNNLHSSTDIFSSPAPFPRSSKPHNHNGTLSNLSDTIPGPNTGTINVPLQYNESFQFNNINTSSTSNGASSHNRNRIQYINADTTTSNHKHDPSYHNINKNNYIDLTTQRNGHNSESDLNNISSSIHTSYVNHGNRQQSRASNNVIPLNNNNIGNRGLQTPRLESSLAVNASIPSNKESYLFREESHTSQIGSNSSVSNSESSGSHNLIDTNNLLQTSGILGHSFNTHEDSTNIISFSLPNNLNYPLATLAQSEAAQVQSQSGSDNNSDFLNVFAIEESNYRDRFNFDGSGGTRSITNNHDNQQYENGATVNPNGFNIVRFDTISDPSENDSESF